MIGFPIDSAEMWRHAIHEEDDESHDEEPTDEVEEVEETTDETDDIDEPKEGQANENEDSDINFEIEEKTEKKSDDELEFKIPDSFESVETERDFYKENFNKIKEQALNPETIATKYEEQLFAKEQGVEELKALREVLDGKPDAFVKIRFKDQLQKGGYDHRLTNEERSEIIETELSKTFGYNYKDIYDSEDAGNPGTLSYNMLQKQQEIIGKIEEFNAIPQQQQQQQVDPEEVKRTVYDSLSKVGVKDENINRFIEDLKTKGAELINDPVKLYKALYSDKLTEKKIAQAREEGRKEALAEIRKVGTKPINKDKDEKSDEERIDYTNNKYKFY